MGPKSGPGPYGQWSGPGKPGGWPGPGPGTNMEGWGPGPAMPGGYSSPACGRIVKCHISPQKCCCLPLGECRGGHISMGSPGPGP